MFYLGCGTGSRVANQNDEENKKVAVTVGDYPVYADDLAKQIDSQRQTAISNAQGSEGPDALPPKDDAFMEGRVIQQAIEGVACVYLAHKQGIQFSDDALRKQMGQEFEMELMREKFQIQQQQQKSQSMMTDKQLDDFLKASKQPSIAEQKKQFSKTIETDLKDTKIRATLESALARQLLTDALESRVKPSDAELKANYDSYEFKRIQFSTDPTSDVSAQITKAQADLKGGLTFEQAMDRYSKEPPLKGKKVSDNIQTMMVSELNRVANYAALKKLKPGEVSDVIDMPAGKAIFKLISVKNSAPADLLKNKATYVKSYASGIASDQVDKSLKELVKSSVVKWDAKGYKALYDYVQANNEANPMASAAETTAKFQPIVDEAKKAVTSSQGFDSRAALLAWYGAFDAIWAAKDADKTKLRADRIEVLKALTADTPYFTLKLELVDLEIDAKSGPEAAALLLDAASSNYAFDATGQRNFQDINARLLKLRANSMLTPDQEKAIQKAQDDWLKNNADVEKQKADAKKAEAVAQAEADKLKAQQLAEAAKARAEASKQSKGTAPAAPGKTSPPPAAPGAVPKVTFSTGASNKAPAAPTGGGTAPKKP